MGRSLALAATTTVVTLALFAVAVPLLRGFARTVIYPAAPVPFPPEDEVRRAMPGAAVSLVRYAAPGGPELTGALVKAAGAPPAGGERPVLLFFHGNAECAAWNLPFADALSREGLDVFLAEYRGYGGSGGRPTEEGLVADGLAAADALSRLGYGPSRLVLVGRSLGTGVATELAVRRPAAALVLVSPYTSIVDMGRGLAGPLAPLLVPDRFDNLAKLPRVACPVVLIHGTRDDVVPVRMARALSAAAPRARYVEVPEASHNEFPGLAPLIAAELRSLGIHAGSDPRVYRPVDPLTEAPPAPPR